MDIQTAIAILETKKLTCCNQKEFIQAADMAIAALRAAGAKINECEFSKQHKRGESAGNPRFQS